MSQTPLFDATGVLAPELLAPDARPEREMTSDDLELGKAAEHLVCADLIMQGYRAFLSDQGLPYDILVDVQGVFVRVQVKATRKPKNPCPATGSPRATSFSSAGPARADVVATLRTPSTSTRSSRWTAKQSRTSRRKIATGKRSPFGCRAFATSSMDR